MPTQKTYEIPQHTHNLSHPDTGDPLLKGDVDLAGDLSGSASLLEDPTLSKFSSIAKVDDFQPLRHVRVVRRGPFHKDQVFPRNALFRHQLSRPGSPVLRHRV